MQRLNRHCNAHELTLETPGCNNQLFFFFNMSTPEDQERKAKLLAARKKVKKA